IGHSPQTAGAVVGRARRVAVGHDRVHEQSAVGRRKVVRRPARALRRRGPFLRQPHSFPLFYERVGARLAQTIAFFDERLLARPALRFAFLRLAPFFFGDLARPPLRLAPSSSANLPRPRLRLGFSAGGAFRLPPLGPAFSAKGVFLTAFFASFA